MAVTNYYCDFATGNDYTGATFTDGAFTNADMTLTKAGAFAASKVNHWLYLDDNGSGEVTAGYYKISSKTSDNAVVLATDPRSGASDPTDVVCTQHDGTALLPFRSVQGAVDLVTRNSTDGDQINVKAGTAQVNEAALDLTTFIAGAALSRFAPLIVRGCTTTANDGGIGEIDCGGAALWAATTYDYVILRDLEIHSFGDNNGISLRIKCVLYNCEIHKGASAPSGKGLVVGTTSLYVIGCYVHDPGTNGYCIQNPVFVLRNFIDTGTDSGATGIYTGGCFISENIIRCSHTSAYGIRVVSNGYGQYFGNICYNTTAGTKQGILLGAASSDRETFAAINNIVVGWSGEAGIGIYGQYNVYVIGYNAYYNNTTNLTISDQKWIDLTANDVQLLADPFVSAATGNFMLTDVAKAALRSAGWPSSYLGASASLDPHITIGVAQYGEAAAAGGMVKIASLLGRSRM